MTAFRRPRAVTRLDLNRPVPLPPERCMTGKLGWFSERDALTALKEARANRYPGQKAEQAVYRCDWCPSWHLTSKPRGEAS